MYVLTTHYLTTNDLAGGLGVPLTGKRCFLNTAPALPQCCSALCKNIAGIQVLPTRPEKCSKYSLCHREESKKLTPREHYFCNPPAVLHSDTDAEIMHIFRYHIFLPCSIILVYQISVKFHSFIASRGCPSKYY